MEDKAPWEPNAAEYVGVYDYTTEVDANDARLKKNWINELIQHHRNALKVTAPENS